MQVRTIQTIPYADQIPGTSGLRKKTRVFLEQKNYLENFIQSIFNVIEVRDKRLVLGGDGRYFGFEATQIILKMAIANGAKEIIVGQNGLFSTPALSLAIRQNKLDGGIILTASHNPGGLEGDFGVKFNGANGAPAPESLTTAFAKESQVITSFCIADVADIDLHTIGDSLLGQTLIRVINPVKAYADLMEELFDFEAIRDLLSSGFKMHYDAFNAVTGPYAIEIFEKRLGAQKGSIVNVDPLPDFGGRHPDPNLIYAKDLVDLMYSDSAPDFGAAADGDGDRYMVLGKKFFVSPADSLAVLADNAPLTKGYQKKITGVARSLPTAKSLDRVALQNGWTLYEVPTGWKFFGNLLDAGKITFCGEESFSASSPHIREKDGIWALLFWLNILAKTGKTVQQVLEEHWKKYGRGYACRYDYDNLSKEQANMIMDCLRAKLPTLGKQAINGFVVRQAQEFNYTDPITGEHSLHQGILICFEDESRIVFRISGTGTQGSTIRLYFEKYDEHDWGQDPQKAILPLWRLAMQLGEFERILGYTKPSLMT